jgi:hypothetical protein
VFLPSRTCARNVALVRDKRNACRVLVGKPGGKRPLGRPGRRCENNIKIYLREIGWGMSWILLAQDGDRWRSLVSTVMNLGIP